VCRGRDVVILIIGQEQEWVRIKLKREYLPRKTITW
jgi:hypothetical protein